MERIKVTQEQMDYLDSYDLSLESEKIKAIKNISDWYVDSYFLKDGLGNLMSCSNVPFKENFEEKMMMINAIQYGYELKEKQFVFYKNFYDHELKRKRKMYFRLNDVCDTSDVESATIYSEKKVETSGLRANWNLKEIK